MGIEVIGKCNKPMRGPLVVADGSQSTMAITDLFLAYDWAITIAWASSDLHSFTPASAPLLTAGAQPTSAPAAPGSGPTLNSQPATSTSSSHSTMSSTPSPASAGGLSTGAKVGIGVGVGLGCVLIILLVAILVLTLKRQRQRQRDAERAGHGQPAWRVQSSSTGNSGYVASDAIPNQNGFYGYAEMDGARPDQQSPFVKPELEAPSDANQPRHMQGEPPGS